MKRKFFTSFIISCICFSIIFTGVSRYVLGDGDSLATNGNETESESLLDKNDKKEKDKNEVLILLMGVDTNSVKNSKGSRTDTMMLVNANFDTGQTSILSIPRDTRVLVNGREDKINHAHAFGGADLSVRTVEEFLNIDIDYFVKVDFTAVKEIVDAIGGVRLDIPKPMRYTDPTAKPPLRINLPAGEQQLLDGQKAHDFLRYRSYQNGDLGRVEAQQYFMKELIKQTLQPKNILNLNKLIKTYYDYVETDISLPTVLKSALHAKNMDTENIITETIPGDAKYLNGISYLIYDRGETAELVEEMFEDYLKK